MPDRGVHDRRNAQRSQRHDERPWRRDREPRSQWPRVPHYFCRDGDRLIQLHSADAEGRSVGAAHLRDYVNATIGFQELANKLGKKLQILMRMLSDKGTPRLSNFAELVGCLYDYEGIHLLDAAE